ncbi:PTS system mannose/fructose/sorbose family IID component, partial [human gut metagenome]
LEENEGVAAKDTVTGIKTGLMGPFAAIGDAIFGSTIPAIMGGLAAGLAVEGNPLGIFLWIAVTIAINVFRWKQLEFAH